MTTAPAEPPDVGRRAVATALRRLMPLLVLMHVIAYVDRLNITFAETELERDLGLSASLYGLAAGIFFLGFVLLEVPSNLALHRFGARRWMARIMITWGLLAAATALVWDAGSLMAVRILLGIAEAGFFPGIVYFLTLWFPAAERARAMGIFMSGVAIAFLLGGPISGALLELDGFAGLHGWQWLFLVEGLPAVLVGLWVLRVLPDRPADAHWLARDERLWLEREIAGEAAAVEAGDHLTLRRALTDRRVLHLALVYLCMNVAGYGAIFWMADIVERIGGLSAFEVGLIAAIPFAFGVAGLLALGRASDRAGERRHYVVAGALLGAAGLVGAAALPPVPAIGAISLGTFGLLGIVPVFWGMPPALLTGRAAAGGIALINAIGVTGGLFGPATVGVVKDATGSLDGGLVILAGVLVAGGALASRLRIAPRPAAVAPAPPPARLSLDPRRSHSGSGLSPVGRAAAVGAIAVALVGVALVILAGDDGYRVRARFQSASQLVKGDLVKSGGRPVGSVESIGLTDDGQAEVVLRIDEELAPLRRGTTATIRIASLTGLANRYVDLALPPGEPQPIPDGGVIEQRFTTAQVDLDQLFNTFDPRTRAGLRRMFRGSANQYAGRGAQANLGYRYLNPSLVAADRLFRELGYDTAALEQFLVAASRTFTDIASRRDDVAALVDRLATTTGAIAREDEALAEAIGELPPFMRRANTTFVDLRLTLDDLEPLVAEAKPVARRLRPYLSELRRLAGSARPVTRDLARLVRRRGADNDLIDLARGTSPLRDVAIGPVRVDGRERPGAFAASAASLRSQTPILAFQRPYAVDLTGWFDDFSHSGVYDANGSASRVALGVNAFASVGGTLVPVPPELRAAALGTVLTRGQNNRCPGAAERDPGDGSTPLRPAPDYDCDPAQVPPGR